MGGGDLPELETMFGLLLILIDFKVMSDSALNFLVGLEASPLPTNGCQLSLCPRCLLLTNNVKSSRIHLTHPWMVKTKTREIPRNYR